MSGFPHIGSAFRDFTRPSQSDGPTLLQAAIRQRDERQLSHLLNTTEIAPDTLHALLAQACQDKTCPLRLKTLLASHSRANPQTALRLAVEHDDIALADEMLKKGIAPSRDLLQRSSLDMRSLLTRARRKSMLYPPNADRSRDTGLDTMLLNNQFDEAKACLIDISNQDPTLYILLVSGRHSEFVAEIWSLAIDNDRSDILRALLLLGMVDEVRDFRRLENGNASINDPGVLAVMKEVPQYSPKRGVPQHFNRAVENVVCRHLTHHRQATQAADPALKSTSYYADVQSVGTIKAKVTVPEQEIENMWNLSTEVHLVDNCKFGMFIAQRFDKMKHEGTTSMQMLLCSLNHTMSLELRIKEKDGRPVYVAKFYDPNKTTSHVRSASNTLEAFAAQDIEAYIESHELKTAYFPEENNVSTIFVRPAEEVLRANAARCITAVPGRVLTSLVPEAVNATVLLHLLFFGFAGNLRNLKGEIASLSEDERVKLLAAKSEMGIPGLQSALHKGHADTVRAFGELLVELVPKEQHAQLLAAKSDDGVPGFHMTFDNGGADTMRAFGELLESVPKEHLPQLLAAKTDDGLPGLYIALQDGQAEAVRAFGELLEKLVPETTQRIELLAAKSDDGFPGLHMALQSGHAETVRAFGELLEKLVPKTQRTELLAAKSKQGFPGLALALGKGHAEAVKAFGELLEFVPKEQCAQLLAAKTDTGFPGLYIALEHGRADAVRAFGELLKLIPEEHRAELLAARSDQGFPGLALALWNGHTEAVKAFGELLELVPKEQHAQLLAAQSNDGVTGLALAQQKGHTEAIKALEELLAAKRNDGVSGF